MANDVASNAVPSRDDLAGKYLDHLQFEPYPVQEEALLSWFSSDEGVLVCAPTGTGKTVIAEAAMFEALHTRQVAYYTTPLIALTEQKFQEMQDAAERWGFSRDDVGLVTGNRRVNPDAKVLVVVAEILLNRLLHTEAFDFSDVAAVVMDEFHSFADPQRGIVWELSLGLLPKSVKLLLLSATVGNASEFIIWLKRGFKRTVDLVQSTDRKVPLEFHWVEDKLLNEQIEFMSVGDEETRRTPALAFCFNRSECWNVAEQLKGKNLLSKDAQKLLAVELNEMDWSAGAGPKLKQILQRGVGVHHAGLLPKYRRRVEDLFQRKLLSVCVCTETLAAGMNLPARSVVMTSLVKGPPKDKKLVEPSTAHQIFGRAGRPQFDTQGHVFALAHEDDVKIARWKEKFDQIPEDTKDPNLRRIKKQMAKKRPTRRQNQTYWTAAQFKKLQESPPGKLSSRGPLPWRLLAYLLKISPEVIRLRAAVRRRLMEPKQLDEGEKILTQMLLTLRAGDFVTLEPEPPPPPDAAANESPAAASNETKAVAPVESAESSVGSFGALLQEARTAADESEASNADKPAVQRVVLKAPPVPYQPRFARATPLIDTLLKFRSINPLYATFLLKHLGRADENERIQIFESVLELPRSLGPAIYVPGPDQMPAGWLAANWLDEELLRRGLVLPSDLDPSLDEDEDVWPPKRALTIADKMRVLFDAEMPGVRDLHTQPVWAAGAVLQFEGDFNRYVRAHDLVKQEGQIFRHLLRLILLCGEFSDVCPDETDPVEWKSDMNSLADRLTESCRSVDSESTDKMIESLQSASDVVVGEEHAATVTTTDETADSSSS
ncbi:MAG: DEAD/DEAH box helicase [Planctomycetota bacterium]|nr:DEAD/DEAH box helicase [Planctomycetota bacterium]